MIEVEYYFKKYILMLNTSHRLLFKMLLLFILLIVHSIKANLVVKSYWDWPTSQRFNYSYIYQPMTSNIGKSFSYLLQRPILAIGVYQECKLGKCMYIAIKIIFPPQILLSGKQIQLLITQNGFILKNVTEKLAEQYSYDLQLFSHQQQYSHYTLINQVEVNITGRQLQGLNIFVSESNHLPFSTKNYTMNALLLYCFVHWIIILPAYQVIVSRAEVRWPFQPSDFFYLQMYLSSQILCRQATGIIIIIVAVVTLACKFILSHKNKLHLQLLIPAGFYAIHRYHISCQMIGIFVLLAHIQQVIQDLRIKPKKQSGLLTNYHNFIMYCSGLAISFEIELVWLPITSLPTNFYLLSLAVKILTVINRKTGWLSKKLKRNYRYWQRQKYVEF